MKFVAINFPLKFSINKQNANKKKNKNNTKTGRSQDSPLLFLINSQAKTIKD